MKKIKIIAVLVILIGSGTAIAQQTPMYSQYMYNMLGVNPAYAGSREVLGLNFFQRNQWVGLRGAPKTTSLSLDQSIKEGRVGLGIQMYSDQLGVEDASGVNAFLSSRIKVSDKGMAAENPCTPILLV